MFAPIMKLVIKDLRVFPKNEYLLKFDGRSKGNPGLAGAGSVIYNYDKEIWAKSVFIGDKITNNEAEYTGLIIGLNEAINMNIKSLSVEGDSMLVIKQMNGEYQVKSEKLLDLYKVAKKLSEEFEIITFNHIHRNNNKRAYELSNMAIEYIRN
jgi:ribonuclease HI